MKEKKQQEEEETAPNHHALWVETVGFTSADIYIVKCQKCLSLKKIKKIFLLLLEKTCCLVGWDNTVKKGHVGHFWGGQWKPPPGRGVGVYWERSLHPGHRLFRSWILPPVPKALCSQPHAVASPSPSLPSFRGRGSDSSSKELSSAQVTPQNTQACPAPLLIFFYESRKGLHPPLFLPHVCLDTHVEPDTHGWMQNA